MRLPGQIGTELRRPPPTAILPHFHHQHPSAAAPAHLHCQKRLSRCPNANNRWHLPVLPNRTSAHPSTCAAALQLLPGREKPTFEVLGMAPRRAALVSSLQRGDTGEVVTHGIGPPGVLQRGPGEAGQERRKGVQVCARASARRRGRALAGLRPGAGGSPSPALPGLGDLRSAGPARRGDPCATRLPGSHAPRPGWPGPWAPARGSRRCALPGSGARVPAAGGRRSGGALPAGHRVGARRATAQRLGGRSVPARGDGRGDVRGALPPAGELAAPSSCGPPPLAPGPSRGRRPQPPPQRRQDSRAPVVMATAAPVNERLSDTRAPALPDVAPGRAAFPLATSSGRHRVGRGVGSRRGTTRDVTSGVDAGSRG